MIAALLRVWYVILLGSLLAVLMTACTMGRSEPQIVYVTATFLPQQLPADAVPPATPAVEGAPQEIPQAPRLDLSPVPQQIAMQPTPDQPRSIIADTGSSQEHIVQAGDTLYGISLSYGVSLDSILAANEFDNPNVLSVGQVVRLPDLPSQQTPGFKIIPDSRLVRGPGSSAFDTAGFVHQQPGHIRQATDTVSTRLADNTILEEVLTSAEIVDRVALEYSVDPRLLLAILEYRAGWLSNPDIPEELQNHPMIAEGDSAGIDRKGLYRQLTWVANQLNWGYYGWKYRGWTTLEFPGGVRLLYAPGLNAGTVGLQYFFSLNTPYATWLRHVDQTGFYRTYYAYFGDPFFGAVEPLVPPDIQQPPLTLPFSPGETWFFTGGWHGGWNSGSAWASIDFAPPDVPPDGVFCYISDYWVTAVAPGVIVRSEGGAVVLDLDGDGDESTGWTVFYLHIAGQDRVSVGTRVQTGDRIGRASCEGGFSTATHLHIARRYNGEWIPADCSTCKAQDTRPSFNLDGWFVYGLPNQEYQGYLEKNGQRVTAEQGRLTPVNRISR